MFSTADTIVAIATPMGRGGMGVVRLSGADAPRIAGALIGRRQPLAPRRATFAKIVEPGTAANRAVDHVVVTRFVAPGSYTGEDVVEISGHGSPVLLRRIVELASLAGARLAEPGEFTLRAYLHGRLDLVQAEAVADLVDAVTPLQARAAMDQLEGTLTGAIGRVDAALFDLVARLEASLDFPDEGFHFVTPAAAAEELDRVGGDLAALSASGRVGRVIREGRMVVIAGVPNAGKSSVFNALVGASRAIVTEVPGTTRDVLTERVDIGGIPVTLVDTAGLRPARDPIEVEGIARARQAQQIAALTLVILDRAAPFCEESLRLLESARPRCLGVMNKGDLPPAWDVARLGDAASRALTVSAMSGEGLDELRRRIASTLLETDADGLRDAPSISNLRHLELIDAALASVRSALAALREGATEELILADLGSARQALEHITGRRTQDDLLRHIFERFCVGK
jgi:tRNA modification GTPase